jgi:serine-type D-Ala-D-Ala carboxypeptidase/endopeptidase
MSPRKSAQFLCLALIFSSLPFPVAAEELTNAIRAYLQHRAQVDKKPGGIAVGLADEHGSRVLSYGNLDNGTDREVDGNSVFLLHSTTGWFTALLLQDMIERGEMKLDDPVAKYLPSTVKVPTCHGQQITLRHLVTETAGLPTFLDKLHFKRADDDLAEFTVEKMYAFLSDYQLNCEPGAHYAHGGLAWGLLGHVIALKAGTNYESLVVDRICRPLKMDSTCVTLTFDLKARRVTEYNQFGYDLPWAHESWGVLTPLGGLHASANDMLKFVSTLGLTPSPLTPLMKETLAYFPFISPGNGVVMFGGTGFDPSRRRCVFIMSAIRPERDLRGLGLLLLESEWQSDRRPRETKISSQAYSLYPGQYERSPGWALGLFALREFLAHTPRPALYIPAGVLLAMLALLLGRAGSFRSRCLILGGAVLLCGLSATLSVPMAARLFCARFHPGVGIHREGDRLFAQPTGSNLWPIADFTFAQRMFLKLNPIDVLLPPIQVELLPQSETEFFERLSGMLTTFSRDAQGKVTRLTVHYQGKAVCYDRISDEPPKPPAPPHPCVAVKLDPKLLDALAGRYELPPKDPFPKGAKATLRREGDHLVGLVSGENTIQGEFDIYPASETNFFVKLDGAQLTFLKNDRREVTALIYHSPEPGVPDVVARRLNN